jgi:hypothetical protein
MAADRAGVAAQRANATEPRTKRFVMLMSEQDHARVKAIANERGVSMARLLQESALSESYERRERLAVIATLNRQERLLGNMANNLNQLAHHANMAQQVVAQQDLEGALTLVRGLRAEVSETLRQVR